MMHNRLVALVLMGFSTFLSLLAFYVFDKDIILSIFTLINLLLAFYLVYRYSPDIYRIKLSIVYLLGFSLFICGRFFSNIFGVDETFCFEFGYSYCLNSEEKIRTVFLINFSLIFFCLGFFYNNTKVKKIDCNVDTYYNKKILNFFVILGFILGLYVLYSTYNSVQKAISGGYMSLYQSQSDVYVSPILLMVTLLFSALVALLYSYRDKVGNFKLYGILSIFLINSFLSVLSGGRANFLAGLILLAWLYLGKRKITLVNSLALPFFIFILFSVNKLAALSGARATSTGGDLYKKVIEDIFYNQGTTMMVFSLGTLHKDYPLLAYIKTILPGSQIILSFFREVYQYELSFSQYLLHKLSPVSFYEGYGIGWSLLGDFYAFSFGFFLFFLFLNFYWGKVIFVISNNVDTSRFYMGIYFCFLISIFILSRNSISPLFVLIVFYTVLINFLKIRWK